MRPCTRRPRGACRVPAEQRPGRADQPRRLSGQPDSCPPIAATKSLSGHAQGATGAIEAVFSLLMMNNDFICESANVETIDPAFADMPIVRERRDGVRIGTVLSNGFGFGGTNASLVFQHPDL